MDETNSILRSRTFKNLKHCAVLKGSRSTKFRSRKYFGNLHRFNTICNEDAQMKRTVLKNDVGTKGAKEHSVSDKHTSSSKKKQIFVVGQNKKINYWGKL